MTDEPSTAVVSLDALTDTPHAVAFEDDPRTVKVTLDAGDSLPAHRHPDETVLFHAVEGRLDLTVGEDTLSLEGGDVARFDGDREIAPEAVTDAVALVVFVPRE